MEREAGSRILLCKTCRSPVCVIPFWPLGPRSNIFLHRASRLCHCNTCTHKDANIIMNSAFPLMHICADITHKLFI